MGIFMNTRHSGSESGHVTAELEALTNEATIGGGNYVFQAFDMLAISVAPVTGAVSISKGVFSWCGRLGGVDEQLTVKYTPPISETLYKKIIIGAKYSKNPATLVESISLEAVESETQSSESAAAGVTLELDSEEITSDTVDAFFPLWEFVASSKSSSTPKKLFETTNSLRSLLSQNILLSNEIDNERSLREQNETAIGNRVTALEDKFAGRFYTLMSSAGTQAEFDASKGFIFFVALVQIRVDTSKLVPYTIPAIDGTYYFPNDWFEKPTLGVLSRTAGQICFNVNLNKGTVSYSEAGTTSSGSMMKVYGII